MPSVVGMPPVPVPSVHELFCISETPNCPTAMLLKMALLCGEEVSWRETDWMDHCPTPYCALNELKALERSNLITVWNSPCGRPDADSASAPAAPKLSPPRLPVGPVATKASAFGITVNVAAWTVGVSARDKAAQIEKNDSFICSSDFFDVTCGEVIFKSPPT